MMKITVSGIDLNLGNPEVFAKAQVDVLGYDHSWPMVAFGTLQPRAAWKLYSRAKNIPFETANEVSEQIDKYEMELKHAPEDEKEFINPLTFIDEEFHDLYEESKQYLGIISDAKIHPCAYLLYNGNISEEIGIIKIKENMCCVMDGLWAEKYSFLKNDLLKVSVVDLIYGVYERIGVNPHPLTKLIQLCEGNEKVWDIYKNGHSMGINQMEQSGTTSMASRYSPKNLSEISALVAGIRPGFKSNLKQFLAREPFSYGIPTLDNIIQTEEFPYSYLLYQENSMQAMSYAGIPIHKTYEVVKNIAKKRVDKVLAYKDQFVKGMTEKVMQNEDKSENEAQDIAHRTWQIIEDSSKYQFNSSHAYSVAGDSLYGAYLKSHYPLQFYEVFLQMLEKDGDKDRLNRAKEEATRAFGISFPPYRFGQDNRKIVADVEKKVITNSLSSIKGFSASVGENMYTLGMMGFNSFLDLLVYAEDNGMMSSKYLDLIKINYFSQFGTNGKLLKFYEEFTKGKARYNKTHTEKTKAKRIEELKALWDSLPESKLSVWDQINAEKDILGYVQAVYPEIDRRYVYVLEVDEKYSPRVQAYCLNNGKQLSVKVQKKVFENNLFYGGDILYVTNFKEKPAVKFVDGKYVEQEGETAWWMERYKLILPETFDKIVSEKL